jgi:hypothetical protein
MSRSAAARAGAVPYSLVPEPIREVCDRRIGTAYGERGIVENWRWYGGARVSFGFRGGTAKRKQIALVDLGLDGELVDDLRRDFDDFDRQEIDGDAAPLRSFFDLIDDAAPGARSHFL